MCYCVVLRGRWCGVDLCRSREADERKRRRAAGNAEDDDGGGGGDHRDNGPTNNIDGGSKKPGAEGGGDEEQSLSALDRLLIPYWFSVTLSTGAGGSDGGVTVGEAEGNEGVAAQSGEAGSDASATTMKPTAEQQQEQEQEQEQEQQEQEQKQQEQEQDQQEQERDHKKHGAPQERFENLISEAATVWGAPPPIGHPQRKAYLQQEAAKEALVCGLMLGRKMPHCVCVCVCVAVAVCLSCFVVPRVLHAWCRQARTEIVLPKRLLKRKPVEKRTLIVYVPKDGAHNNKVDKTEDQRFLL